MLSVSLVAHAMGVAVCLVDSRSFAIACLAAVKSRGGERQFTRQRWTFDSIPLLRTVLRIVSSIARFEIREIVVVSRFSQKYGRMIEILCD